MRKEILFLIEKNQWPVDTSFIDSSLHIDFNLLETKLETALNRRGHDHVMVFYGGCHPLMDKILNAHNTFRTRGQNCLEMLLGCSLFKKELARGAFFLLEDWALG